MNLREAWTHHVEAEDYEAHMAGIGQAQANAKLVGDLMGSAGIADGSRILIAGAGTGQMFDYISVDLFKPYRVLCTDIHPRFFRRLRERLDCETVVDDVEDSRIAPGFGLIVLVLVLEHVDFRKALASLSRLEPQRLLIVIQQNPQSMTTAVTPGRALSGSMRVFVESATPHLVPFGELVRELATFGFHLERREESDVADGKKMIGAMFVRS